MNPYNPAANAHGAFPQVTTYAGESRLLTVGRECLVSVKRPDSIARMLVAVTRDGYRTDYPIAYASGKIGWDNPEWFSKRFLERAASHVRKFQGVAS